MKLPGIALASLEAAFNHLIVEQPEIMAPALEGRRICIDLVGLDTQLYFHFVGPRVIVMDSMDNAVDATIRGTPVALASAGLSKQASARDIHLSGDLQLAQAFEALLKNIKIDWEEQLSRYTGDAIAFQAGQMARGLRQWGVQAADAFVDDLRDYLQMEARQLPMPGEVDRFNREVDDVRAAVERFELRVLRLQDRLADRAETT